MDDRLPIRSRNCSGCGQPSIFALGTGKCGPCMSEVAASLPDVAELVEIQEAILSHGGPSSLLVMTKDGRHVIDQFSDGYDPLTDATRDQAASFVDGWNKAIIAGRSTSKPYSSQALQDQDGNGL